MPPPVGFVKFNMDGAVIGILGQAGIGGILRSSDGVKLMFFSKHIGVADPNLAEILAIKEAFCIYKASGWFCSHKLMVETDSNACGC